jgi:hypothetical protein
MSQRGALALTGSIDPLPLVEAGWRVLGRLPTTPYDDPRDAPSYVDLDELLEDGRVEAVALDTTLPAVGYLIPVLRAAGRHLLLTAPSPLDPVLLSAPGDSYSAVVLERLLEPWAQVVPAALALAGPARQVTVRGWPPGEASAVELVCLVRRWCGDVVAAAGGAAVPVDRLPDGAQVAWSMLTASGATVLVSPEGSPVPLVRLTLATARLDAAPDDVRWEGGERLPLPAGAVGPRAALVATARGLDDLVAERATTPLAGLGDLLAAARVLSALSESRHTGKVVTTG